MSAILAVLWPLFKPGPSRPKLAICSVFLRSRHERRQRRRRRVGRVRFLERQMPIAAPPSTGSQSCSALAENDCARCVFSSRNACFPQACAKALRTDPAHRDPRRIALVSYRPLARTSTLPTTKTSSTPHRLLKLRTKKQLWVGNQTQPLRSAALGTARRGARRGNRDARQPPHQRSIHNPSKKGCPTPTTDYRQDDPCA